MSYPSPPPQCHVPRFGGRVAMMLAILLAVTIGVPAGTAQEEPAVNIAAEEDAVSSDVRAPGVPATARPPAGPGTRDGAEFNLLWLIFKGGPLMVPIGLLSLLVITLVIERGLSLREAKVLPQVLIQKLGLLTNQAQGFDPRLAYRCCMEHPSAASTVVRAMLLKVGRPLSEIERAVTEASEREAARQYANVRWLNLAAAVAPLLGLFGTVWGMIRAFFDTTQLQAGQNKADFLAQGIYVALVTTLGGLAVAIPAAVFSHYFEGRIQGLFYRIEELMFNLLPQIERFEGHIRVKRQSLNEDPNVLELAVTRSAAASASSATPASTATAASSATAGATAGPPHSPVSPDSRRTGS